MWIIALRKTIRLITESFHFGKTYSKKVKYKFVNIKEWYKIKRRITLKKSHEIKKRFKIV